LPGKALLRRTGKYLIQHVFEAVSSAALVRQVVVATDDERIVEAVASFGGRAVMTSTSHANGTERLAQAADLLGLGDDEIVVNVQGDEPETPPEMVDQLVKTLQASQCPMATLCTSISPGLAEDPNRVKVVFGQARAEGYLEALYFSRAAIPFDRDGRGDAEYFMHLGLYAYRVSFLKIYASLPSSPAQQAENLEQLRALEHGYSIAISEVDHANKGIDTPEDYARFVERYKP
jgi:3-deoxy-manno-octulosonate cytidylyltransferase (CMP-KDO synthetase)